MTERFNYIGDTNDRLDRGNTKTIKLDGFRSEDISRNFESNESREYAYGKVEELSSKLSQLEKGCSVNDIRDIIWPVDLTSIFKNVSDSDKIIVAVISSLQNNDNLDKKDISKYLWAISSWRTIRSASKKFDALDRAA